MCEIDLSFLEVIMRFYFLFDIDVSQCQKCALYNDFYKKVFFELLLKIFFFYITFRLLLLILNITFKFIRDWSIVTIIVFNVAKKKNYFWNTVDSIKSLFYCDFSWSEP